MSQSRQINVSKNGIPVTAIVALAIVFVAGLFVVGFDQGHIFSLVYGEEALDNMINKKTLLDKFEEINSNQKEENISVRYSNAMTILNNYNHK